MPPLSEGELAIRQRLKDDLEHYASKCLKIRTKSGATEPFLFNRAQRFIHSRLEAQRKDTGRVRAQILKGRQEGTSTYVGGRFYHRVTHSRGLRVFILTHEDPATQNLFDMVQRFHDNCPEPVRPKTGNANAKELMFPGLDSGYKVGTAGSQGVGRSSTIQLLHASEMAFWKFAASHSAGIMQTVPDEPGTEIIKESTANGIGNLFHSDWVDAERGKSDFIPIFVPWFWQDEYRRAPPDNFILDDEECDYGEAYGLDREQMAWRRNKIAELKDPMLFKQEYPATAAESFQTTGHDSFIKAADVLRARKAKLEGFGPLIMGVDPARFGDDRFSIAYRQGRKVHAIASRQKIDVVSGANWVKAEIDEMRPDRCFIDVGGLGAGVYDILVSWGSPYTRICAAVNFGSAAQRDFVVLEDGSKRPGPKLRRDEMWSRMRDWLCAVGGADIPDDDALHADLCAPGYKYDMNSRLILESKEHMRARGVASPDEGDAMCFEAGTLIATPSGQVRIERLCVGDDVLTPFGAVKIAKVWETSTDRLCTTEFSNGSRLVGKPDHKIFVYGHGAIRLDAIVSTMALSPLSERHEWLRASGWFTAVRSIGFKTAVDILAPGIPSTASGCCIAVYGLRILDQFRKIMKSTIKTGIGEIRSLPILNCLQEWIMSVFTPLSDQNSGAKWKPNLATCEGTSTNLKRGIRRPPVSLSIRNMAFAPGKIGSLSGVCAGDVERHSHHWSRISPCTAQEVAGTHTTFSDILLTCERAVGAAKRLLRIGIGRQPVVLVHATTENVPPTLVYNLTLDRDNAYYANDLLVFNCLTFAEPVIVQEEAYPDFEGAGDGYSSRSDVTGY